MTLLRPLMLVLAVSLSATAQAPATNPQNPPASSNASPQSEKNAASAAKDNSGISGDQVTKPVGAKSTTVIGCLTGPDADGKFELHSMQYRTGVEVLGPENLKDDAGSKVKLTGVWQPGTTAPGQSAKSARRFQASEVEVLAAKCQVPAEQTPVSKQKK